MLLSSLKVVEVAGSAAVSIAAGLLGDLGASVVLVEPPGGAALRRLPAFQVWSRGKHSVATDDAAGVVQELAPGADIVLVDRDAWTDLGRPTVPGPAIVVEVSASNVVDGPRIAVAVAPSVGEAEGGLSWTQRGHRDGPFYVVEEPAAMGAGLLAVIGALAARLGGHHGSGVSVSHTAGAMAMQLFSAVASPDAGNDAVPPDDGDAQRVTTPLVRFYECRDGWITIGVVTPARWANLCVALDMPELISDPRFDAAPFAIPEAKDRIWLVEEISRRMKGRSVADWLAHLQAFDVIAAPVLEPDAIIDHEQVRANDMRWEVDDPALGPLVEPGCPILVAGAERPEAMPAPAVGQHSAEVLDRFRHLPVGGSPRGAPVSPPLTGTRVLDLSTFGAGPGAARLLAGLGADVVKLEPPGGDPFRLLGYSFVGVNAGKRTGQLDIGDQANRAMVDTFLAAADVVVHNYRSDVAEKLGMRAEDISAVNPAAVQCAVSGYGARGPMAGDAAIDVVFESWTGGPLVQGGGSEPVGYTGGFADNGTSLMGAVAVLASLVGRTAGTAGDGSTVAEVSLLATTLYRHADLFVRPLSDWRTKLLGVDPVGPDAGHRIYPTADGWVLLAVADTEGWAALRATTDGLPAEHAPHDAAWDESVAERLEEAWAARGADELVDELRAVGVPITSVERFGDVVRRARARDDDLVQDLDDRRWGALLGVHELVSFSGASWAPLDGPTDVDLAELASAVEAARTDRSTDERGVDAG